MAGDSRMVSTPMARAGSSLTPTYPVLRWILGKLRRGDRGTTGSPSMINKGIPLVDGEPPRVPLTPGLLIIYLRKPYLERQDPETGEVIHEPRARAGLHLDRLYGQ